MRLHLVESLQDIASYIIKSVTQCYVMYMSNTCMYKAFVVMMAYGQSGILIILLNVPNRIFTMIVLLEYLHLQTDVAITCCG